MQAPRKSRRCGWRSDGSTHYFRGVMLSAIGRIPTRGELTIGWPPTVAAFRLRGARRCG